MPVNEIDERVSLVSLEETRLHCFRNAGDHSRDELLIEAINEVSGVAWEYCGREFKPTTGSAALGANVTSGATTLTLTSIGDLPTSNGYRILVDSEIMLVTAGAGTTSLTVTRAQNGTTAAAHSSGATVAELEARVFRYAGTGSLDLAPFDLREIATVTLYTDRAAALQVQLAASQYRLTPVGRTPGGTYLGLDLPYPSIEEPVFGFRWQATVLGRWGMPEVPWGVKLGAKIWIDNLVKNPAAAASTAMNGHTFFPEQDEEGRRAGMPPATRHRWEPWLRPGSAGRGGNHGVVRFANVGEAAPGIPNTLPLP